MAQPCQTLPLNINKDNVMKLFRFAQILLFPLVLLAQEKEITEFFKAVSHVAKLLKVSNLEGGYRALSNIGKNGGQEVPHLHFHIFGGEKVGKMVS